MVKFIISQALFEHFPKLRVGVIIVHDFNNLKTDAKITQKIRSAETQIKQDLHHDQLGEYENINVWRQAYSFFGAKPKKYKASVEALIARVLEGDSIPSISTLVDAYNYISLKYRLPLGADDLGKLSADVKLTFAQGTETFHAINSEEIKNPECGEVVYKCSQDILCRRWNWRESDLTKITPKTTKAILYCESLLTDESILDKALQELQSLIGGEIRILDTNHNALDLDTLKVKKEHFDEFYPKAAAGPLAPPTPRTSSRATSPAPKSSFAEKSTSAGAETEELYHWADVAAQRVIQEKGDKEKYVVAAGITPSGTVHIGNFREIITADLVRRALEKRGKKVRFIYSWDDYDVFRKVPKNMPKQEVLQQYLRKSIVETPDTFGCHHSYAQHHEKEVEQSIPHVGIIPEFLYQAQKYRAGEYNEEIKFALENTDKIKVCLNEYRDEEVDESWLPISIFCAHCGKDTITDLKWQGGYKLLYACDCGHKEEFDFRKKGIVKLKWRIDWPMRWHYEKVDFEPGGKDHSTVGGSFDTGKKISKAIWNYDAPSYVMYDFINVKGKDGKMSSSKGDVIILNDVLEIYEPEVTRWLFAGTRPNKEFNISFDADVIKIYEDFDKCERIYFGQEKVSEKDGIKSKSAYELSCIGKLPTSMPFQPGFRHITTLLQIHEMNLSKVISHFSSEMKTEVDRKRVKTRIECAKNWLLKYAPNDFKFSVQEKVSVSVSDIEKKVLHQLAAKLGEKSWTDIELHEEIYSLCTQNKVPPQDFFKVAYRVLINKERGPRLAAFMLAIGKEKVAKILKSV